MGDQERASLLEIEREMARLDEAYRPVATRPLDLGSFLALTDVGAAVDSELAQLGVGDETAATLRAVIAVYREDDETTRAAIRSLFDRYPSFRWAAHLPRDWAGADDFRDRLAHLRARSRRGGPRRDPDPAGSLHQGSASRD